MGRFGAGLGAALLLALVAGFAGPLLTSAPKTLAQTDPICSTNPCDRLTIHLSGNGSGSFKATNAGSSITKIDCNLYFGQITQFSVCTYDFRRPLGADSITINYTFDPDPGNSGCWAVACNESTRSATITLSSDLDLSGTFSRLSYTVVAEVSGSGYATINPGEVICTTICQRSYLVDTPVTITASQKDTQVFMGWSLDCAGQANPCSFSVPAHDFKAIAVFGAPTPPPTASPSPTPTNAPTAPPTKSPTPTKSPAPTRTPAPTVTAAPTGLTPSTFGPGVTPTPIGTAPASATLGPGESPVASQTSAGQSGSPEPTLIAVVDPSAATPTPDPGAVPVPTAASGTDLTPIVLAILGAGLLIAFGIAVAGFALRSRQGSG